MVECLFLIEFLLEFVCDKFLIIFEFGCKNFVFFLFDFEFEIGEFFVGFKVYLFDILIGVFFVNWLEFFVYKIDI